MAADGEVQPELSFTVQKTLSDGARLGLMQRSAGRRPIQTPCFMATASRGAVPHLSPDMITRHLDLQAVYMALEDFVERAPQGSPPVLSAQLNSGDKASRSSLRRFTSLPDDQLLVLGARRSPPVPTPMTNSAETFAICTSVGFHQMETDYYQSAAQQLRPDVVVALGDVPFPLSAPPGIRRREKMAGRTERWVQQHIDSLDGKTPALFAPLLPVDASGQAWYLESLVSNVSRLSGLAIYEPSIIPSLPSQLFHLPRLSLAESSSPHAILQAIALGSDIVTAPFVSQATDAGIALSFDFVSESSSSDEKLPIGLDCSIPAFATDLGPLVASCPCYTCSRHHRAYLHHLLAAREMLAWTLLAVHNHIVVTRFFAAVRESIAGDTFDASVQAFVALYQPHLPSTPTSSLRLRGYQQSAAQNRQRLKQDNRLQQQRDLPLNPPAWKGL